MKTHKVNSAKLKQKEVLTITGQPIKVYYVGKHPYLINSMGTAIWHDGQNSWIYKPEVAHAEWYRVHLESLAFEKITLSQ